MRQYSVLSYVKAASGLGIAPVGYRNRRPKIRPSLETTYRGI